MPNAPLLGSAFARPATETPLMRQWRQVKERHPDDLVFFRVGDFFELFGEDAQEGSRLLGLTLTSRNNGAAQRVPLAGVPARALNDYVDRLVRMGRKAVICDQMEDASEARGIVRQGGGGDRHPGNGRFGHGARRGPQQPRRRAGPVRGRRRQADAEVAVGLAALDVTTGQLTVLAPPPGELAHEIERLEPSEILLPESVHASEELRARLRTRSPGSGASAPVETVRPDWLFELRDARDELLRRYQVHSLDGFGFEAGDEALVCAAGALVAYAEEVRPGATASLQAPRIERSQRVMALDSMTRRNLELVEPLWPDRGGRVAAVGAGPDVHGDGGAAAAALDPRPAPGTWTRCAGGSPASPSSSTTLAAASSCAGRWRGCRTWTGWPPRSDCGARRPASFWRWPAPSRAFPP